MNARYDKEAMPTFYTICPYCYYMYVYETVYQDCCLRCQACRKAFHAVPTFPPQPEAVMVRELAGGGKEEGYRVQLGRFARQYCLRDEGIEGVKDKKGGAANSENVVVISSDDDEDEEEVNSPDFEEENRPKVEVEENRPKVEAKIPKMSKKKKNVKILAWNTKKITGRGVRIDWRPMGTSGNQRSPDQETGSGHGDDDDGGELQIKFDGDEVYIEI